MSEQSFEMIAKTFQGLEEVLAQELTDWAPTK
jgi:putative N6-adenine-specific DNA methylase